MHLNRGSRNRVCLLVKSIPINQKFRQIVKKKGMSIFLKNVSIHGIQLEAIFEDTNYSSRVRKEVVKLVNDGIANGTVKPLNYIIFKHDQAEQAFRWMDSDQHKGKVVLKIRDEEPQKRVVPVPIKFNALTRTTCNPEKLYIINDGLGDFGLELCQWLIARGARHILLTSCSGLYKGYQTLCINRWRQDNIQIIVSKLNARKKNEVNAVLKMAAEVKPVAAIFDLALVLKDDFIEQQRIDNFTEVLESKVTTTLNLHTSSIALCPELDWFVCFSSVISGYGIAGQSSYGYAGSLLEHICQKRSKEGLPGLAIQLGPVGDVETGKSDIVINGMIPQKINSCLNALEKFLQQKSPVVSSYIPYQPSQTTSHEDPKHSLLATVGNILGIKDVSALNLEKSLGELGMDSLMGLEMKNFLKNYFNLKVEIPKLRELKVKDIKKLEQSADTTRTGAFSELKIKENSVYPFKSDEKVGVKIPRLFDFLTSQQLIPSETIVRMNSVENGTPLFIVHPFEGNVTALSSLALLIDIPVFGIQCTPQAPSESIEQLAAWYWKHVKAHCVNNDIHLAGYSFGGSVAFEMCLQAEYESHQYAKVRSIIILDGSPALMNAFSRNYTANCQSWVDVELETQLLCSYVFQFLDININEFKDELISLPSFDHRIKKSVEKISSTYKNLKTEDLKLAFNLYYKKHLMSLKYTPRYKLKREVMLIKSSESIVKMKTLSENFDLEKICNGKIIAYTVKGTHNTFILKEGAKEVSSLLNKIFSL